MCFYDTQRKLLRSKNGYKECKFAELCINICSANGLFLFSLKYLLTPNLNLVAKILATKFGFVPDF